MLVKLLPATLEREAGVNPWDEGTMRKNKDDAIEEYFTISTLVIKTTISNEWMMIICVLF
jgi:hypothetical protein